MGHGDGAGPPCPAVPKWSSSCCTDGRSSCEQNVETTDVSAHRLGNNLRSPNSRLKLSLCLALAGVVAYVLISHATYLRENVSKRDSIAYWTAGRLLLHGQDPYDADNVLNLERGQGYSDSKPLVLRTPPWSLFLVLPLGLVGALWAWLLWVAVSLAALVLSMHLCWRMYGSQRPAPPFFGLVGYTFAPVAACLVAGQMGILLLLGIVLFLYLEQDHPFLAGAALILPFAKPHLLSLFWLALLFWVVMRKSRAVATGFLTALSATTCLALAFDPAVFQHYRDMLYHGSIGQEFIPAFSGVLRLLFFHRLFWAQFVPMAVGLIWCMWFYFVNRSKWNWQDHGLTLLVVSLLTTPYAWLTDEVIVLPAILQAAMWIYGSKHTLTLRTRLILVIFAGLNLLLLLILWAKVPFATGIYFWSSLVWFGWYAYGLGFRMQLNKQCERSAAAS